MTKVFLKKLNEKKGYLDIASRSLQINSFKKIGQIFYQTKPNTL